MLWKLMKHEFRATARIFVPLYLVVIMLVLLATFSLGMTTNRSVFLQVMGVLLIILFVVALYALLLLSVILMLVRFYRNLMTDEGYLMFTLPVRTSQLILSKLIVSLVWFAGAAVVAVLALYPMTVHPIITGEFNGTSVLKTVIENVASLLPGDAHTRILLIVEGISLTILTVIGFCLMCYAAIAVGQSFRKNKVLLSVVFFFVFNVITQIFYQTLQVILAIKLEYRIVTNFWSMPEVQQMLIGSIVVSLLLCGGYYFLTHCMLKRRLNLQ